MELVQYVPWKDSPDKYFRQFMSAEDLSFFDPDEETGEKYSLPRLHAFFHVYENMYNEAFKAVPVEGDQIAVQNYRRERMWWSDNRHCLSMYMAGQHNSEVRADRRGNDGVPSLSFVPAEELDGSEERLQSAVNDELDDLAYPDSSMYLPPDTFAEIIAQPVPAREEVAVAFATQCQYQDLEDMAKDRSVQTFIANVPEPAVRLENLTFMQRKAYDKIVGLQEKCLYISGMAGSGKTAVAQLAAKAIGVGKVQCGALTGRAASNFGGPTLHSMFGLSANDNSDISERMAVELRKMYEHVQVFVFDEIDCVSPALLARIHRAMNIIWPPKERDTAQYFGDKNCVFLGDPGQIPAVKGTAIWEENVDDPPPASERAREIAEQAERDRLAAEAEAAARAKAEGRKVPKKKAKKLTGTKKRYQSQMTILGKELYRRCLVPNSIILTREQRGSGLLQEIADKMRNGMQEPADLEKLTYLLRKFPDCEVDNGISYTNELCSVNNWMELWQVCKKTSTRMTVCKATYDTQPGNSEVVDGLARLPQSVYSYAPDVLCLAVGASVRVVQNLNLPAGLVNGAVGTVVKVVYDNSDMHTKDKQGLLDGKLPPPYFIVVDIPTFQGYILDSTKPDERWFPFQDHSTWVPIFREKFVPLASDIPQWIRKRQSPYTCYRIQFPLDLSKHMTAHRSQVNCSSASE